MFKTRLGRGVRNPVSKERMDSKKARDSSDKGPAGMATLEAQGQGLVRSHRVLDATGASHINTAAELRAK